jgi:Fic family protein
MPMIERPPKIHINEFYKVLKAKPDEALISLIDKINEKYEYWSDIKYKNPPIGMSNEELWTRVKFSRMQNRIPVWPPYRISLSVTNYMQRLCHTLDMNFGGSWGSSSVIPDENKEQYLISSLMEEAISSSQMEGAATTRKVAKDMLRKQMSPKDKSQQMITNNYQTICFIVENKDQPLTEELLKRIHVLMTEKTLEKPTDAGKFRDNDEVVVENGITHEIVHTPPSYHDIPLFVDTLCKFFNEEQSETFIHPIIRGIIIHFMVSYMHPFSDGNGRTARALFYWYMLRQGYWLTEYLSISRIIAKTKKSYEKAFLYTEADELDIGYFVTYHLHVLEKAFDELKKYITLKIEKRKHGVMFFQLEGINERQADILGLIQEHPGIMLTIKELENRFSITHPTAKTDIDQLVKRGYVTEILLNKVKSGYIKGDKFDLMMEGMK